MRILYFSKSYTSHDYRFLSSLAKTKHEVFYLKLEANPRQTEDRPVPSNVQQLLWAGGQREFRWRDLPHLTIDFRRLTKEIKPDIVHAGPIQTSAFIALLSGFRPVLTMSWAYDLVQEVDRNKWMKYITQYVLRNSAYFISDARITRDRAVAFGMDPERTVIFPWGIDLESFIPGPSANRKSSTANRKLLTLFCSRTWERIYGVDVLAKAFVKVAASNPNVDLILLGAGSQGAHIRQILMNGGVLDRVHFGGQVRQNDLPRWYRMADVYISPSHVDGSSVSLLEALASGLPCLVSDIPGNREWIMDGENGWLFRDGNVDDLAEKILHAIKSRRSFKKIGEAARKTAEQKADWTKNFGKLLQAYDTVLSLRGANDSERRSNDGWLSGGIMLAFENLVEGFRELGVEQGDTLLVHSSYKSLGGVDGGPQIVINALEAALGPDGTLIMPTFNFDFNKGVPWDVRTTPSKMGVLTELVRVDPRAKRVFHPFYSFAVLGKHAELLGSLRYKSSYERNSVFGKLRDLDGKIMVIGLSYTNSMTFFHHIEQMEGVDYRVLKQFTGEVTDENGNTYTDTFEMLARDIDKGVITEVDPMGELMEKAGIIKSAKIGEADVKLMKANEVYEFTAREMKRDPHLLYYIDKKKDEAH